MLVTATLSAALAVGVASGTAAATERQIPSTPDRFESAAPRQVPAPETEAAAPETEAAAPAAEAAAAPETDPATPGTATPVRTHPHALDAPPGSAAQPVAVAARQKARPQPVAPMRATHAWVNPLPAGRVTSCFGPRWGRRHQGVDLAAPHGTPVVAAGAGVVVRAAEAGGYGNAVLIDHGNGYLTQYGHLSAFTVTAGQHVTAGQQIGAEGSTGHSTGPHLHFEVHEGHYRNQIEPTAWMRDHGVPIPGCEAG